MLRGIAGVAAASEIANGSFYLQPDHAGPSWVFLRVAGPSQNSSPGPALDLVFDRQDRHGIFLQEPRDVGPVAILQPVGVRIDPTSQMGTAFSSNIRPGMLSVAGTDAFVTAQFGHGRGRSTINLATGDAGTYSPPNGWMSFSKWSLVVDDGDKEITLVSYSMSEIS